MKDYTVYKAHYCGVCHSLKKTGGLKSTVILSYDAAMLGLLKGMYSDDEEMCSKRCVVNPLRKLPIFTGSAEIFAADINIIYAYLKCVDDINDENSFKAKAGELILRKAAKSAMNKNIELVDKTKAELSLLSDLEKQNCDDIDAVSLCSGRALAIAFEKCSKDPDQKLALNWLGQNIGRWVYLCDAIEDMQEDIENSSYNVLVNRYDTFENMTKNKDIKEVIEYNLLYSLNEASKALDLLKDDARKDILSNIICESCVNITQNLINTGKSNLPKVARNSAELLPSINKNRD